jgi:large subunit ribosomal protein L16
MLLFPKQTKYNKSFSRKRVKVTSKLQDPIALGDFAVMSANSGRLTSRQIESVRRLLRRNLKKQAKI